MSDEFKVGDEVTYEMNGQQLTSVVTQIPEWLPHRVYVKLTDDFDQVVHRDRLTRLTPAPQPSAIALVASDYDEEMTMLRQAGSIGAGVEL